MSKPIVIALGEILWDMLPTGKRAGGAPVNFAISCVPEWRGKLRHQRGSATTSWAMSCLQTPTRPASTRGAGQRIPDRHG